MLTLCGLAFIVADILLRRKRWNQSAGHSSKDVKKAIKREKDNDVRPWEARQGNDKVGGVQTEEFQPRKGGAYEAAEFQPTLDLNVMDRFPHSRKKQHNVARKSSPYDGRRPGSCLSTSYGHKPKALNVDKRGFKTTFDHDHDPHSQRRTDSREYRGPIARDAAKSDIEQNLDADNTDLHSDSDDSAFHWDEEATLISDLMEAGPEQSGDEYLETLADTLQAPFTEQGKLLKKEIAQTLVPTNNHVKAVIQALEKKVDATYHQGLSLFNKACKNIEGSAYAQYADFNDAYERTRSNIEKAYEELEREYSERDKLWVKLNQATDEIVTAALHSLREAPAKVENTINKLEKHAKSLGKAS